jgi:hypothetical protein
MSNSNQILEEQAERGTMRRAIEIAGDINEADADGVTVNPGDLVYAVSRDEDGSVDLTLFSPEGDAVSRELSPALAAGLADLLIGKNQ